MDGLVLILNARRNVILFAAVALALVGLVAAPYIGSRGMPAPQFSVETIEGKRLALNDVLGQVVLLDFMATWCIPCRLSMPEYLQVYHLYQNRIVMVSVSIDPKFDSPSTIRRFAEQYGANWIFARDISLRAQHDYSIVNIPTLVLIDRSGFIRFRFSYTGGSFISASEIAAQINKILG